jgi:uncharacterized RDD family membrane protein YckC
MSAEIRQLDSTVDVVTPENISFRYQLAGPFQRFPAFLLDLVIRLMIWFGMLILMAVSGIFGAGSAALGMTAWLLVWFVLEWFYGGLLETFNNGQTIGKRLLGMRVLRIDGQPINGLQAVMRNILRLVDMMPLIPLGFWDGVAAPFAVPSCLFGLLIPTLWGQRYQRLGDLVCGTMVVVEERRWQMSIARIDDPAVRRLAAELPASFQVDHKLSQALASYVERRRYLSSARRAEIARHLGELLTAHLGPAADTDHDRLLCALYYRTFVVAPAEEPEVAPLRAAVPGPAPAAPGTPPPTVAVEV